MSLQPRIVLGVASAVAASVVAVGPAAAAAALQCGQTVTVSTKLTRDLTGCPGTGLVVGADGITIDLGGHSIRGVNAADSVGIANDGHPGVTIKNGTISDFFVSGIRLHEAPDSVVRDVRVLRIGAGNVEGDAAAGVFVEASAGVKITDSKMSNDVVSFQSDGVVVLGSPRVVVRNNRIDRNSWNGLVVIESPDATVVRNTLDGNGNQGIEANVGSDRIVVARNHARGNTQNGLVVGALHGARIVGNRLSGNAEAGLFMFDLIDGTIAGNVSPRNAVGILLAGGQFGSHGNRVVRNRTDDNGDVGILLDEGANENRVSGNTADGNRGSDGAGILVFNGTGNAIDRNVANDNAGDGIAIFEDPAGAAAGNSLSKNTANRNDGHGINAVDGTIDGGGNKARANGTPPDCLGVICS
jgi:parallel beta-helix repeat protein